MGIGHEGGSQPLNTQCNLCYCWLYCFEVELVFCDRLTIIDGGICNYIFALWISNDLHMYSSTTSQQ